MNQTQDAALTYFQKKLREELQDKETNQELCLALIESIENAYGEET